MLESEDAMGCDDPAVLLCKDAQAAFTSVDTDSGLREIRNKVPGMFTLMRFVYGVPANVLLSGVRIGCISKGSRQGTVGGPLLYMAATQPRLVSAAQKCGDVFVCAATDDVTIVGVRSKAVACGEIVMKELGQVGIRSNVSKDKQYCQQEADADCGGIEVLGQPVGVPGYCQSWFDERVSSIIAKLKFLRDHVVTLQPSGAFLYLKHSIGGQIRFVSRAVNTERDVWAEVQSEFLQTVVDCITGSGTYGEFDADAIRLMYQLPDHGGLGLRAPCPDWKQALLASVDRLNKRPEYQRRQLECYQALAFAGDCAWASMMEEVQKVAAARLGREGVIPGSNQEDTMQQFIVEARASWKPKWKKFYKKERRSPLRAAYNNAAEQTCFKKAEKTPFKFCTQCIMQPVRHMSAGQWRQAVKVHMGMVPPVKKKVRGLPVWLRYLGLSASSLKVFDNAVARRSLMKQLSQAQKSLVSMAHAGDVCRLSEEVFAESIVANIVQYGH
jgi:hypothetical protein